MGHAHGHHHAHGHRRDRGWRGALRYTRKLPSMLWSDVSRAVVADVAPEAGEHVVDIGAGMGPATVAAARRGAHVLAIDPTPFMRRVLGARRLVQRTRRRITVVDGAAESIPAADGTSDAVWAVNSMHHWDDMERASAEIARVLRPGGRVVLVDQELDFHGHFDAVDPEAVAAILVAHGFASARGSVEQVAGGPAKVVRAVR